MSWERLGDYNPTRSNTYIERQTGEVHGSTEGQERSKKSCEEEITAGPEELLNIFNK